MSASNSRKRSEVWLHFRDYDDKQNKAKCCYCLNYVSVSGGSTSNLTRHLKLKHPTIPIRRRNSVSRDETKTSIISTESAPKTSNADAEEKSLDTLPVEMEIATPSTSTGMGRQLQPQKMRQCQSHVTDFVQVHKPVSINKAKQFDNQLVKMIAKEYHSFRMVEGPEFKKFIHLLNPGYVLPSRKTLSTSLVPKAYNTSQEAVKEKLVEAIAVCLTTDGWKSTISCEHYTAVTVHFIDNQGKLCTFLLGCVKIEESHTSVNLGNRLKETAEEWGITNKVTAVVTDNAPNEVGAVRHCGWRHIPCFAHTINLIVKTGKLEIQPTVDKVKAIVEYVKRSTTAQSKLQAMQQQMNLPVLKLKQDVEIRWNSTYDMLDRILKVKDAIIATLAIINNDVNKLTDRDWVIIKNATEILKIFYEVTVEISSEKNVTLSKVLLLVGAMNINMQNFSSDMTLEPESQRMVQILKEELKRRFRNVEDNELMAQATFLDPRFKKYGFSNESKFLATYAAMRNKLSAVALNDALPIPISATAVGVEQNSLLWGNFDSKIEKVLTIQNPTAAGVIEMDKYLAEPLIGRSEDPLIWWWERKLIYPRLYQMVLKRLCIVATSVPCERVFSKAGLVLTEKRNRLSHAKVNQILFLNANL